MTAVFKHLIQSREYTSYHGFEHELDKNSNYLFDLSYLGILDVVGDKALDFLQGQISSDARKISPTSMIPAALCNLKGRILTLMHVLSWRGIHCILPLDQMEKTKHSLEKTAMLSRVNLKENQAIKLLGFYLQNPKDILPIQTAFPEELYAQTSSEKYCCYHLGQGFYIFLIDEDLVHPVTKSFMEKDQFLGSLAWHSLRLMQKDIEIYPSTRGLFLPHRLNLHETAYLSFDKGCYKGQEIIARMHYRAAIKHELRLCTLKSQESIVVGQKFMHEKTEVGEIVDYSYLGDKDYLIVVSILKERPDWAVLEGLDEKIIL